MFTLWGTYKGKTEEIDSAEERREAEYLLGEYRMAFGPLRGLGDAG